MITPTTRSTSKYKAMRIHILQHVGFEGEGIIADWALSKNMSLSHTRFYLNDTLPAIDSFDFLVIMGGPMGIYDEDDYPYLASEKVFIKDAIARGKKVLGICLGSQLLADCLGAKVKPNTQKEIGWFPIEPVNRHPLFEEFYANNENTIFHWHGDTFDLPKDCIHLFKSAATPHQAFIYNNQAIGLQFHLELKPENLEALIANTGHELTQAPYIQDATNLREGFKSYSSLCKYLFAGLLNRFFC